MLWLVTVTFECFVISGEQHGPQTTQARVGSVTCSEMAMPAVDEKERVGAVTFSEMVTPAMDEKKRVGTVTGSDMVIPAVDEKERVGSGIPVLRR